MTTWDVLLLLFTVVLVVLALRNLSRARSFAPAPLTIRQRCGCEQGHLGAVRLCRAHQVLQEAFK